MREHTKYTSGSIDITFARGDKTAQLLTPIDEITLDAPRLRDLAAMLFKAAYDMEHGLTD